MSELVKNILMWLFIAATLFTVFNNFSSEPKSEVISYSEFLSQVESDQVLSVQFENDNYTIKGKTVNDRNFETVKPPFLQDNLSEILRDHRVSVIGEKPEEQSIFKQLLVASFPILIILAVLFVGWFILNMFLIIFGFHIYKNKYGAKAGTIPNHNHSSHLKLLSLLAYKPLAQTR